MAKAKRRLKDLFFDLIALVKSPATMIPFAVIKSTEGGDELVDEILQLVQEICADKFEGVEKAEIPEGSVAAVKDALTELKGVIADLPESAQAAIKALVKIAGYGHAPQKKSADTGKTDKTDKTEDSGELVKLLEEIQTQVVNSDQKFASMMEETKKTKDDIQKSLTDLTSRLSQLETATGKEKAKSAEDTKKDVKKSTDVEDLYESVIPGGVML